MPQILRYRDTLVILRSKKKKVCFVSKFCLSCFLLPSDASLSLISIEVGILKKRFTKEGQPMKMFSKI